MKRLALVPICDEHQAPPAAMHECAAARYVGMNKTSFRQLLKAGVFPYSFHQNGKRRIFHRCDLDAYLEGLPRHKMDPRENQSPTLAKGVGK